MTKPSDADAIRDYVHFLREHDGVRQIKLTRAAQEGLAKLAAAVKAFPDPAKPAAEKPPARPVEKPRETRPSAPVQAAAPAVANEPPLEIAGSSKVEQLKHLAERASVCVKCPHLAARRHNVVFGVGNPDAKL